MNVDAQFPEKLSILFKPNRYKVLYGGRYGMKSWGIARALLILGSMRPLRILCCREFQTSIDDSVHQLLTDQVHALGLSDFYGVQKKVITGRNGTTFGFEGLRLNINGIKSYEGADIAWVEEAHTVSKNSWSILIPTIRKSGSEIWISFNPEFEDDETFDRFVLKPPKNAIVVKIGYEDNPWISQEIQDEIDDCKARSMDDYDWIWAGNCRKWLEGAIYASELRKVIADKRICSVPYDDAVPVYTSWDLGHTDDTCIWWYQIVGGEIHILECYGTNGGSVSEYASQVLGRKVQVDIINGEIAVTKGDFIPEIAHRLQYRYETHNLPHDARAKTLAANGKSIIEQMAAALGLDKLAIVPEIGVEDGIQAARMMFGRCWFDSNGT